MSHAQRRSSVPVWMMGLTNALFGMYGGILVISVPQLLSARQVPEATIAAMTAVMTSVATWSCCCLSWAATCDSCTRALASVTCCVFVRNGYVTVMPSAHVG